MILVRNVFQLKFGKARDALALWPEFRALVGKAGYGPTRALTDLTGPAYTFVFESSFDSLAAWESSLAMTFASDEWRAWYQRFSPLVESSHREIYRIVE
ncbi:MAG: NIPSNAP family protein [Gemmatimonadetes bacterium]|nr:NIPSNAP family protein [Gemmatimonadota bacterium]